MMRNLYRLLFQDIPSWWYCVISGLKYKKGYRIKGRVTIIKRSWINRFFFHLSNGTLKIGVCFKCNNKINSNSVGLIQPCVFNIASPGSSIVIGDNVGISGSTICSRQRVTIGDNVLIGSGCLITDSDAHPIGWLDRFNGCNEKTLCAPVVIGDNVFIGARSIILKGVTIGDRTVIGAGSVVTKNIPADSLVAGNPAKVIRTLK